MSNKKSSAFFEAGSWYHRIKILLEDGTTKYSKKGGFRRKKKRRLAFENMMKNTKRLIGLTTLLNP